MRASTRHVVHAVLLSSVVALVTSPARAQPAAPQADDVAHAEATAQVDDEARTNEARARFNRGVELYREGDYGAATIEFRRAYEIVPNWRIQYNLAQACAEAQDYPCAERALKSYLEDGGGEIPADRRLAVEAELKRVSGRIARVTVNVNRPDAEVFADETKLGRSPLSEAVPVSAGRRRLSATLPSGRTISKIIEVAGGDEITVDLDFEALTAAPRAVDTTPTPVRTERPSATPVVIGLVATGLLAAGTATTGILSLSAKSDYDKQLDTFPGSADAISSARSRVETLGLVTDVLGAATIVAAGVSVYLIVTRPSKNVAFTVGPGTTGVAGRF